MNNQKIQKKINDFITKSKSLKRLGTLKKHPDFGLIVELTNFLQINTSVSRRLWHILNSIYTIPTCKMCTNPAPWKKENGGLYRTYCSQKCSHNDPVVKEKTKETNLKKYGHKTPMQNPEIRDKIVQGWQQNLGVDNPSKSKKIKEKKKQTCLEHCGFESSLHHPDIIKKREETILKKFGEKNIFATTHGKDKIKQTNLERYGVEYPTQSKNIKDKIKQTNLERYDTEHLWSIARLPKDTEDKLNNKIWLYEQHHEEKKSISEISIDLSISPTTVSRYLNKHDIKIITRPSSLAEKEIIKFIQNITSSKITTNSKKIIPPYELDIFIPELNIAIEYNGLYWHSEFNNKDKNYHLLKTEMCEAKGIRLIHIFEDEWRDQQQKCKDTLKHLLGKSEKGTYARNTIIKEIPWKQAKDFLNKYHLLNAGTCGNYRIGAFDKQDNLIGVMVFGIPNNENANNYYIELKRFVTDKKNNPGLGSKMFKYATTQQKYKEVIAFVDRRWFTGLVKQFIGFKVVHTTSPALWWTNGHVREHRRFKTKRDLIKMGGEASLTKCKLLKDMGYVRIWDCGKLKLLWEV